MKKQYMDAWGCKSMVNGNCEKDNKVCDMTAKINRARIVIEENNCSGFKN